MLSEEALERVRARQEITELRQRAALEEAGRAAAMQRERKARLKQQVRSLMCLETIALRKGLQDGQAAPKEAGQLKAAGQSVAMQWGYFSIISTIFAA